MEGSISIISESPIELEPDPDSIRGVSPTFFDDVSISHRNPGANTPVGSLSTNGLDLVPGEGVGGNRASLAHASSKAGSAKRAA